MAVLGNLCNNYLGLLIRNVSQGTTQLICIDLCMSNVYVYTYINANIFSVILKNALCCLQGSYYK